MTTPRSPRPPTSTKVKRKRRYVVSDGVWKFAVFDTSSGKRVHVADGMSRTLARRVAAMLNGGGE